jgi:hypothetical protein
MLEETLGLSMSAPSFLIHFRTAALVTPNNLAINPYDAFPSEYRMTAKALLAAASGFARLSPNMKLHPQLLHL